MSRVMGRPFSWGSEVGADHGNDSDTRTTPTMAASAFVHSKLSKISIDTAGNVLTDISDSCDSADMPEDLELVETTSFGATSKTYIVGFADGKFTCGGSWNRNIHVHMAALKAALRDGTILSASVQYGPEGTDTGDVRITFESVLTSFKKNSAAKDQVKWEAEFQITGAVTEATF